MNSHVKFFIVFFNLFLIFSSSYSQNEISKKVTLKEKKNGKRLELYAQNNDSISYSIFLRITTTDYRKSSNRPVLSIVEPNSKKHLLTLIKLADKPGDYEKQFIVNQVSQKLSIRKDFEDFEINFDNALKTQDITIYESQNCTICEEAKILLTQNQIAFKTKSIISDSAELIKALENTKQTTPIDKSSFALKIKSTIYPNIKTKAQLIKTLKSIAK